MIMSLDANAELSSQESEDMGSEITRSPQASSGDESERSGQESMDTGSGEPLTSGSAVKPSQNTPSNSIPSENQAPKVKKINKLSPNGSSGASILFPPQVMVSTQPIVSPSTQPTPASRPASSQTKHSLSQMPSSSQTTGMYKQSSMERHASYETHYRSGPVVNAETRVSIEQLEEARFPQELIDQLKLASGDTLLKSQVRPKSNRRALFPLPPFSHSGYVPLTKSICSQGVKGSFGASGDGPRGFSAAVSKETLINAPITTMQLTLTELKRKIDDVSVKLYSSNSDQDIKLFMDKCLDTMNQILDAMVQKVTVALDEQSVSNSRALRQLEWSLLQKMTNFCGEVTRDYKILIDEQKATTSGIQKLEYTMSSNMELVEERLDSHMEHLNGLSQKMEGQVVFNTRSLQKMESSMIQKMDDNHKSLMDGQKGLEETMRSNINLMEERYDSTEHLKGFFGKMDHFFEEVTRHHKILLEEQKELRSAIQKLEDNNNCRQEESDDSESSLEWF